MNSFTNKKIAILGLGIEGISSAKYLKAKGAEVTLLDEKKEQDIEKNLVEEAREIGVKIILGKKFEGLKEYDLIVRSPGIRLQKIDNKNITSQTKLFLSICPCEIIGITGTKGKGTTSSLIYEFLKKEGFDVYLGGNIGVAPFSFLDKLTTHSKVVLELSSFQLLDIDKSPHIAILLMITSEHLDYHTNLQEYIDAKRNILKHQAPEDFAIVNRDYPASNESDIMTDAKVFQTSREGEILNEGVFVKDKAVWLKKGNKTEKIIDTREILLKGEHNLENVCPAIMAAFLYNVSIKNIVDVLKSFKGLEHRLELVSFINGVEYYDDSFSTTPETAIAAINSFENPEILILGGSSKNSNFEELGEVISKSQNIKAIIGIGEEWEKIKKSINNLTHQILIVEGAKNMNQIVQAASKIAEPNDVVLLSPACASFGMFKNYKDRGDQFKQEVEKLKNER